MWNQVNTFIRQNQLLQEHSKVLLGVSGGPDSMALLHFFYSIRDKWHLDLVVLTIDHQLRGDQSKEDLNYVERICKKWRIKFVGTSLDVPTYKQKKQLGTQMAARNLRYAFFAEQMKRYKADYLVLGHHGDDQVETVLMALVRSANPNRLAGIPLQRDFAGGEIIRPLLCVTKAEIEAYCQVHAIMPRRDPSNEETAYTRNYFRKTVLPLVKEKNNSIHKNVQHLSRSLQEDEAFLNEEAQKMVERTVIFFKAGRKVLFNIHTFQTYARSLQRRAYQLILNYLYQELPKDLSYMHEENFFLLLQDDYGSAEMDFPKNLKVQRSYENIALFFSANERAAIGYHKLLPIPGKADLPNGFVISGAYTNEPQVHSTNNYICLKKNTALPLHVRTRLNGDRMHYKGLNGSKKIKDIFIDAKIPASKRDTWPIVTDNDGTILWIPWLRKASELISDNTGSDDYIQLMIEKDNMQEGHHA